jgi:hypothetical protein
MVGVSGSTNSGPWTQEIEFKIADDGETSYGNMGGQGNRTHIIVATFSGITGGCGSNYAVPLIDGSYDSGNCHTATAWGNANFDAELKFDFGAGNAQIIDEFTWFQDNSATHGAFNFAGSNDDSSYTDLLIGLTLGGATSTAYPVTNTTGYRYYKLYQTGGLSNNTSWLEEIEFKTMPSNRTGTSYDNLGGRGVRSALITGSYSGLSGGCGSNYAQPLVDGSFVSDCATSAAWGNVGGAVSLTFDFGIGESRVIDEFSWWQDIDATHGTWTIAGSDDDSSYTDLLTGITLGVSSGYQAAAFPFTNTTGYRYYRLTKTGGSTSSASWNREIEFKIK